MFGLQAIYRGVRSGCTYTCRCLHVLSSNKLNIAYTRHSRRKLKPSKMLVLFWKCICPGESKICLECFLFSQVSGLIRNGADITVQWVQRVKMKKQYFDTIQDIREWNACLSGPNCHLQLNDVQIFRILLDSVYEKK